MQIISPNPILYIESFKRLNKRFNRFVSLIDEVQNLDLEDDIIISINDIIENFNLLNHSKRSFSKQLRKAQNNILKILENKLNIVPTNHYSNKYMAVGIAIGVGLGSAIGASVKFMGQIGLWLPIGLAIGLYYGKKLDNKAKQEGRALNFELK